MQENKQRKKSSPQTRLMTGLFTVAIFATAFTFSAGLLTGTADAMVQPAVVKNADAGLKLPAPATTPIPEGTRFVVDLGSYTPKVPLTATSSVTGNAAAATAPTATASSSTPAASSQADASSAAPAAAPAAGFDPATVGGTGFVNIPSWKALNSDVVGWIRIPNTNINYPVLYHADTTYYLERDVYKNWSRNGVIWADQECQFGPEKSTRNTVLYGHNWTNISRNPRIGNVNDVMFAQLTAFQHLDFAQKTPYVHFSTAEKEQTWIVFAAFYTDINFNYIACYPNDTLFANIVTGAKARSEHIYDVDVQYTDKILTLSTCTRAFGSSANQRFVVMARAMRPGESTQTPITVSSNPSPLRPVL